MSWPARVYWVDAPAIGRLGVVSRPRSASAFAELKSQGIDVLVSLLEHGEAEDVGLADEAAHCERAGIAFIQLPITDHGIPSAVEPVALVVSDLVRRVARGQGVGAHCYAGLGRSPLLIAAVLIAHGMSAPDACDLITQARGHSVPERDTQARWLDEFELRLRG